jgi:ferric-dicitrate binding protein FerR (iron transport regulator)
MFAVVRDPVRPFVVTVPGAAIEVIGTQFGLVAEPSRTTVDVREGALRLRSAHHDASIDIVAGSRATIRPDGSINVVAGNAIQNVPLGLVAEALNKHHRVPQIRVEGSACEKRIGMNWAWDDPEEFVRMLTNDLGFSATRNGDEVWIRYGHDPVPVGPAPCAKGVISLEVP